MSKEKRMDTKFQKRLKRHLYYGDMSDMDKPSFPLTELVVDYFHDCVPDKLGHVDMYNAADIIRKSKVSPASMVLSMLYAKRLRQTNQEYLHSISSSDIFFISMMMASKYLYDEGVEEEVFNDEWADNSDQDVECVNQMEMDFLRAIDWRLFVSTHDFDSTLAAIERRLALQEGLKRNWFTYSELDILLTSDLMTSIWHQTALECSKAMSTISAVYLTGIFTLLGSSALAVQVSAPLSVATLAMFSLSAQPLPVTNVLTSLQTIQPTTDSGANSGFAVAASEPLDTGEDISNLRNNESQPLEEMSPPATDQSVPDVAVDAAKSSTKESSLIWSIWVLDSLLTQLLAVTRYKAEFSKKFFSSKSDGDRIDAHELNDTVLRERQRGLTGGRHNQSWKSQNGIAPPVTMTPGTNQACSNCLFACFNTGGRCRLYEENPEFYSGYVMNKPNGCCDDPKVTEQMVNWLKSLKYCEQGASDCEVYHRPLRTLPAASWIHPSNSNLDHRLTHTLNFLPGTRQGIKVT